MTSGERFSRIKRLPDVQQLRSVVRHVLYFTWSGGIAKIRIAERGRKHIFRADDGCNLFKRSRTGMIEDWSREFALKRKKGRRALPDAKTASELIELGLDKSTAKGILRLGIGKNVEALAAEGVPISRAANMWLTSVRRVAISGNIPLLEFPVIPAVLADSLALVDSGQVPAADLDKLLETLVRSPGSSAGEVARWADLEQVDSDALLRQAVLDAISEVDISRDQYLKLGKRMRNRIDARLIGYVKTQLPSPNMRLDG